MCHCAIMLLNSYSNPKNEDFNWSIRIWKSYNDFCIKQHRTKTAMGRGWKNSSDADRNAVAVDTTSATATTSVTSATFAIDTVATTSETGATQENVAIPPSINICGGKKKAFEPNSSQTNCNHTSPEAAAKEENDTVCIHYDTFGSDSNDIKEERIQFQVTREEENDEENEEEVIENWYDALEEGKEDSEQNENFMKNKYGETNSKEILNGKSKAINALVYQTKGIREIKEEIPYDWKDPIPKSQEVPPKEMSYWQPLIIPPLECLEYSRRTSQTSRKLHTKNKRKCPSERSGSTNYYNGNVDYIQSSGSRGQYVISTNSFGETCIQNKSREFDTAPTPPKFMRSLSNCQDGGTSLYTKGKGEDSFRFNGQDHTQSQYFGQNVTLYRESQSKLAVSTYHTSGSNAFPSDGNNNIVWPSTSLLSNRCQGFPIEENIAREEERYSLSSQEISYDHHRDETKNAGESSERQYNFSNNLHNREEATNKGIPSDLSQIVYRQDTANIKGSSGWRYDFSNMSSGRATVKQTDLYGEQPSSSDILYDQAHMENEAESCGQQYDLSNLSFSQKETTNNIKSYEQQYALYDLLRARETARKAENFQGKPGFHFLFGYENSARRAALPQWQYNSSATLHEQGGTENKTDLMLNRETGNDTNENRRQYHGQKQTGIKKNYPAVSHKQSMVSRQDIYVFLLKMALTVPKKWNAGTQRPDESNGEKQKKGNKCLPGIFRKETNQNDSTNETWDIKEKNEGNGPSQTDETDDAGDVFGAIGSERRYRRFSNEIEFSLFTSPLQQESGRENGLGHFYPQWPLFPASSKASNEEMIMYNGRNILDLGQNIRDPSWQLHTPQMDVQNLSMFIDNRSTYHRLSKFAFNDDPSKWVICTNCNMRFPVFD